jgi:hypothetical protein
MQHTLRLHGCFPHERIRVHFVSQRYSWQHGIDFSFKPHRHRFNVTCRHFKKKFYLYVLSNLFFLLIRNHQYDIDVNIDEDHNQVFDHMYHHMSKHLLNILNFHILNREYKSSILFTTKSYSSFHTDMFACLVEDKDHMYLYDIYVYNDEFDNLIIDYMAKTMIVIDAFKREFFFYLIALKI